jgi:hypothetical protein
VNDIKASLAFGSVLVLVASWLIRWHCRAWKEHSLDEANDDRARLHYRRQFRRRIQVAALVLLLGVMIPLGDWLMVQRKHPQWIAIFWLCVLVLAMWIMMLAAFDWLSTRMHVRATRAALGTLVRKQRELEAEVERLRGNRSNGRH